MVRASEVVSLVLVLVCRTTSRASLTNNGYNNVLVAISPEVGIAKKKLQETFCAPDLVRPFLEEQIPLSSDSPENHKLVLMISPTLLISFYH